jgi:hypothetical protein
LSLQQLHQATADAVLKHLAINCIVAFQHGSECCIAGPLLLPLLPLLLL